MADGIELRIITPEGLFHQGTTTSVMIKTTEGWLGVLPGRAPFCALLTLDGCLRFRPYVKGTAGTAELQEAVLTGGFAVMDGNLIIYAAHATWAN